MSNKTDWSCLLNTYWYVLPENLSALQFDPDGDTLNWIIDQTVWHITGYRNGYFWGSSATAVVQTGDNASQNSSEIKPVCFSMVGSITPEGRVYITFIPCKASSSRSATIGVGRAVWQNDAWSLEMQMSSGNSTTTSHWAYMTQVQSGDPAWDSLPGVSISVSQMLDGCCAPQVSGS